MSFLQPILLLGLPLALLPVIIHLMHRRHDRREHWAAMMFLIEAVQRTKGLARLRQILILVLRVFAVVAMIAAAARPLTGAWMGLSGGSAETLILLLDRSASMGQLDPNSGESKRSAALTRLDKLIATRARNSEVVLIDSATFAPTPLPRGATLADLPETEATATAADIPTLLRSALGYMASQKLGRTDVWLASDLQESNWNPSASEWGSLRQDFAERKGTRLFLLAFADASQDNLSLVLHGAQRVRTPDGYSLALDLSVHRSAKSEGENAATSGDLSLPLEISINGTRTVETVQLSQGSLHWVGHPIPLSQGKESGWGRIDLPADENPADNMAFFTFDAPAPRKTVIVSDDAETATALRTVASVANESDTNYEAQVLSPQETAVLPWQETALLFWQAELPADSDESALLRQHVAAGRSLVFLPPGDTEEKNAAASDEAAASTTDQHDAPWPGLRWTDWMESEEPMAIEWWRTETGLLANTRSGAPLPLSEIAIRRTRLFEGNTMPLLKAAPDRTVIARVLARDADAAGSVYVWGTLPRQDHSNFTSEGIVLFAMVHRALADGASAVSLARILDAGPAAVTASEGARPVDTGDTGNVGDTGNAGDRETTSALGQPGLIAGVWEKGDDRSALHRIAVNRPASEDDARILSRDDVATLLADTGFQRVDDSAGSSSSLAAEIWRLFLVAMALALVAEALLSLPPVPRRDPLSAAQSRSSHPVSS